MTGQEFGLFIVEPDWAAINEIPIDRRQGFRYRSRDLLSQTNDVSCPLVESESCVAEPTC